MTNLLSQLTDNIVKSAEIAQIYIEDGALRSAEAHLTDLEEHVAHLRRDLDAAIQADNESKRAWFRETTGVPDGD